MRSSHISLLLFIWLGCAPPVFGKMLPSFDLATCSWEASDIVVVATGDRFDGQVQVTEAWKGGLKKGERLAIPEIRAFARESARVIVAGRDKTGLKHPHHATGSTIVLFLRQSKAKDGTSVWHGANPGGIKVSIAWLEQGKAYVVFHPKDDSPPKLQPLEMTGKKEKLRDEVEDFLKTQKRLEKAKNFKDAGTRADALVPFAKMDLYFARRDAFQALAGCGEPALIFLRGMLADDSLAKHHNDVVKTLALAGGAKVGPDLTDLVEQELAFWKKKAPTLEVGWWNGTGLKDAERFRLQNRYSKVLQALWSLRDLGFEGCRKAVTEFRDFWRSLPQLEDRSGLNQMSEACDDVLRRL